MGMEIITGYTGEPHIRPEDDGARNAGIFGTGKYVLNVGRKFAAEIVSNNMVKIKDGDLINQGRHIRIPVGETEECTIENGTQARYRNDLIVSRYSKESGSEGKESAKIVVIKGTASTSSTPPDPSYTSGDILNGALTDDFPLYRVKLNGLSITAVEPLFGDPVKSLSELNTDIGLKTYDLVWQDWITPYASTATVVNGICIVSLCFEIKSPVGQFTNLGVVEVPGVKAKEYINTSLAAQGDGRCVDCLIDPGDEKAGYIYINARGLEFPANTVFRGQLVYPVWRTIVL